MSLIQVKTKTEKGKLKSKGKGKAKGKKATDGETRPAEKTFTDFE